MESILHELQAEIKALRKDLRRVKALLEDPTGEKSKARATNNGFNKPLDISEPMRAFLKLPAGEQISRSQVTKKVNEYVTEKGLKAGQSISMDATLKELLNPPEGTNVTFLNIQKFINPHYIKKAVEPKPKKPEAAAPETPAAPKKKPEVAKKPATKA
jgi:upstream activation factor subunit UAF30